MSVLQTVDGGYISAGSTASVDFDVTGNHGIYDVWVVKFGSDLGTADFSDVVFSVSPNPVKIN